MRKRNILAYFEIIIIGLLLQRISCIPNIKQDINLRKLDSNESDPIPDTINTTFPTTIITTLPTTIITTFPTTIFTTFPTNIITNFRTISTIISETIDLSNHNNNNIISNNDNNSYIGQEDDKWNENKNETLCNFEEVINGSCTEGKMDLNSIKQIKENLFRQEGDDFYKKIRTGNVIIQFSNLDEQKDDEVSSIDLGDCEEKLRLENNITEDKQLIVYKVDIKNSDKSSTYVQYEVYNPDNKNLLDISICDSVTINTPVDIGNDLEEIYNSLSESGYNLFDSEDDFYQDICSTYTTANGTDMLLSDRKKDIYSTTEYVSLCQSGCELESYNSTTKKAKCNCGISTAPTSIDNNLDIDSLFTKEAIKSSFYDTLSNSNFRVLKCYKKVFSSYFVKNIGEIFMTAVTVVFIGFNSLSFVIHQKQIKSFIINITRLNHDNLEINSPSPISEKNPDLNNNNNEITEKKEIQEKQKKKKGKKKKKKKTENNLYPPKKSRKKNRFNKMENEISNNDLVVNDKINNNDPNSIKKNDISIYPNDNNEKIKDEKENNNELNSYENSRKTQDDLKEKEDNEIVDINTLNDQEINNLKYEIALKIDKRTYLQYYWSLLKKKQLILFTFWPANDYNLITIKISLFLLSFGLYFSINGFFFTDDTMHKIYVDKGVYNFVYQIPQILFSTIISAVINVLLKQLSLTESKILSIKEEKDTQKIVEKAKSAEKCLRIKFIIYFSLSILFMLFFWYFISCFCAVYKNTQIILIKDTVISYALSMIYPFGLNLLPGLLRIPALKAEKGDQSYKYKISTYVALI